KNRRVDDVEDPDNSLGAGLHKLTPGVPAAKFVLPPAFSHGQLLRMGRGSSPSAEEF
ncbi:hypothetical protein A2U01_0112493, partial [Trifolium medium]|nr:hypothetical protein [Trifolium medium]